MTLETNNAEELVYHGVVIQRCDEMLSLTDKWRAACRDPNAAPGTENKRPSDWLRSADAKRFIDTLAEVLGVQNLHTELSQGVSGGSDSGGETRARWQIGLAYAKYLSPEFHAWSNTVVRERMAGRTIIPPTEEPAQQFGQLGQITC